jgi:hypothetical protein
MTRKDAAMDTRFRQILNCTIAAMVLAGSLPALTSPAHAQLVRQPASPIRRTIQLAFPDLVVQGFRLGVADVGGPFLLFTVKNVGTGPAAASLTHVELVRVVEGEDGSSLIARDTRDLPTQALRPGESATLVVRGFGNAETRFEITVDAQNQIFESSERNNLQVID